MTAGHAAYPVVSRECGDDRRPKPHVQITCAGCKNTDHVPVSGASAPPAVANQAFRRRGWIVGRSRTHDRCPKCNPRLGKAKVHAAVARIAVDLPAKPVSPPEIPQPIPNIKGVEALPNLVTIHPAPEVRQPTREDRRRIVEEISANYTDIGYVGTASDATLAAKLNVPRAWVSAIRDEFFGPDQNEATISLRADVQKLIQLASSLEDRAMTLAAEAEALRHDAERISSLTKDRRAA